jgi:prepilin-type N-terminal cleavage/methylation domain-containing protein
MRLNKNKKGFTLVELIIVLSILGITISAIYTFFFFAQDSFSRSDRQSRLIQDMNLAKNKITRDIRSASKPNAATNSVVIPSAGQSMDIYTYNSATTKYIRISYRLSSTDRTVLQRGTIECTTTAPPTTQNPSYGTISNWETVLTGVIYRDASNVDIKLFKDNTSAATNDRRKIVLNIGINDLTDPLPSPIELKMSVTSRSTGVS